MSRIYKKGKFDIEEIRVKEDIDIILDKLNDKTSEYIKISENECSGRTIERIIRKDDITDIRSSYY